MIPPQVLQRQPLRPSYFDVPLPSQAEVDNSVDSIWCNSLQWGKQSLNVKPRIQKGLRLSLGTMPSSSELKRSLSSSSSSGGKGPDISATEEQRGSPSQSRTNHRHTMDDDHHHHHHQSQQQESPSIPELTLSPEQRTAIEQRFWAARAGQTQSHVNDSSIRHHALGLPDTHQVFSPSASLPPQLDQAALLQMELRQQQQQQQHQQNLQRSQQQQQPLGLLAPALADNALQQAAAFRRLNDNALSLLQLQQQQRSLLSSPLAPHPPPTQSDLLAAIQAQQQLELARQQQYQRISSAASLPLPRQLDPSLAMATLGASSRNLPPVAALPDVAHLLQRVPAGQHHQQQQRASYSPSSESRSSSGSNKEPPPFELPPLKKPKRPLSSYNFFFQASRKRLRAQEPDIGFEDLARRIGKEWGQIDSEALAQYEVMAQKDRERYWRELEEYKVNMDAQLEQKRAARKKSSDEVHRSYFATLKSGKKRKRP